MSQDWVPGMCNEKAGFLFSHACDQPSLHTCAQCGKPICMSHGHHTEEGIFCTLCAKGRISGPDEGAGGGYTPDSARRGRSGEYGRGDVHDDPYFYSDYYVGYGMYGHGQWGHSHHSSARGSRHHDANDFTEADAASLAREGDEDFETDMGES